jgi:hypothetical protein
MTLTLLAEQTQSRTFGGRIVRLSVCSRREVRGQ